MIWNYDIAGDERPKPWNRLMNWKLESLLKSRRFWVAVVGVVAVAANDLIGLSESEVEQIGYILIAWIVGDSVNTTGVTSKRIERGQL